MIAAFNQVEDIVETHSEPEMIWTNTQPDVAIVEHPGTLRNWSVGQLVRQSVSSHCPAATSSVRTKFQLAVSTSRLGFANPQPATACLDNLAKQQQLRRLAEPAALHAAPLPPTAFGVALLHHEIFAATRASALGGIDQTGARAELAASSRQAVRLSDEASAAALAFDGRKLFGHRWCTPSVSGPRRLNHARGLLDAAIVSGLRCGVW